MDVKDDQSSMKFNIVAGVIDRARQIAFERMLWRVSKGNVFIKFADIEESMEDPKTGGTLYKSVFMIFFQVGYFHSHKFNLGILSIRFQMTVLTRLTSQGYFPKF